MELQCLKEERRYALLPIIMPETRILTVTEACAILHVGRNTMSRMLNSGVLKGFRMPNTPSGHWKIAETEIARYVQEQTVSGKE